MKLLVIKGFDLSIPIKSKILVMGMLFLFSSLIACGQTIWYVKANATGLNNGSSWADAFSNLQPAIDAARASTGFDKQVWVAAGTYRPTQKPGNGIEERDKSFTLVQHVKVYGGFTGVEPANFNLTLRNIRANETTLSGDIGITGDAADNSYHVIISAGPLGAARLDGFTIKDGNANGTSGSIQFLGQNFERSYCGGLYSRQGSDNYTLANCIFEANKGINYGAIYNFSASPKIQNCIIRNNIATGRGILTGGAGGLSNKSGSDPIVVNCLITGNKGDDGGGVTNAEFSSSTYINCTISGNTALGAPGENNDNGTGGGMQNFGYSTATLYNCIVWGNTAREFDNLSNLDAASRFIIENSIIEGGYTGTPVLDINPLFLNPVSAINAPTAAGDYHVTCNSVAINAGSNFSYFSNLPNVDLDFNPRIIGSKIDLGAYEFQTSPLQTIVAQSVVPGFPFRYCPGAAISVGFTINNCPGNFAPGNIFTLQLSDANGSFIAPVSLGTLASANAGNISGVIPASAIAGNGYRIRIISSSQPFISQPFNIELSILSIQTASITISANAAQICAGDNVVFTSSINNVGASPSWQWKKNGINVGTNSSSYSDNSLVSSDVITCELTNTGACGGPASVISNGISVAVNSVITTILINTPRVSICSGETASFSAVSSGGGNNPTFQWKKNGQNVGTNTATYNAAGLSSADLITCELTSNAVCASTASVLSNVLQINVSPVLVPAITIAANKNEICPGDPVSFLASISNGGSNPVFQWKKNMINVGTNSTSYLDAGLQSSDIITCELQSNAACVSPSVVVSNQLRITVGLVTPVINIIAQRQEICVGERADFRAVISNGGNTPFFQWKKNGINAGTNSSSFSDAGLLSSDIISCSLTSSSGCVTQATVQSNILQIPVNPLPVISLTKSNDINCLTGQAKLLATGGIKYEWQPAAGLQNIDIPNPVVRPSQPTTYSVKVSSSKNCSAIKSISVNVSKEGKYELYNSFTPNNDGINDCFGIRHMLNISSLDFSIYDRWGDRVFYTKNASQCWDGNFNGQKQETGTYIYILKGSGTCGLLNKKGTVLLVR